MIVSLTGFMGCGKSSVGTILAERLGWKFIDLDRYIEHKKGMSVQDIFASEGETAFRALEAECLRDTIIMNEVTGSNLVLALGGGTITIHITHDLILEKTECVFLETGVDELRNRLSCSSGRPLLEKGNWEQLLESRLPAYLSAPVHVLTDNLTPSEVADEIIFRISRPSR